MLNSTLWKKGNNQEYAKESNRSLVLDIIWKMNAITRTDLSKITGLKQATITNIVNDLLPLNLVEESGKINNGKGRNQVELEIVPHAFNVLAIRFTRKFFSIGVFDLRGNVIHHEISYFCANDGFRKILTDIVNRCKGIISANKKIISVGVALPGPIIKDGNKVTMKINFPDSNDVDIMQVLENKLNLPISITHDANAGLIAEFQYGLFSGSLSDYSTVLYIAAGQGNGCGMLLNREIFEGSIGTAGELGHTSICFDGPKCECGNYGCLDKYCSTIVLSRMIDANIDRFPNTILKQGDSIEKIISAIINSDDLAVTIFKKMIFYLGIAVTNLINLYNPNIIIFGDELSKTGDIMVDSINSVIKERIDSVIFDNTDIKISKLEGDSVLIGASVLAIDYIFKRLATLQMVRNKFS